MVSGRYQKEAGQMGGVQQESLGEVYSDPGGQTDSDLVLMLRVQEWNLGVVLQADHQGLKGKGIWIIPGKWKIAREVPCICTTNMEMAKSPT